MHLTVNVNRWQDKNPWKMIFWYINFPLREIDIYSVFCDIHKKATRWWLQRWNLLPFVTLLSIVIWDDVCIVQLKREWHNFCYRHQIEYYTCKYSYVNTSIHQDIDSNLIVITIYIMYLQNCLIAIILLIIVDIPIRNEIIPNTNGLSSIFKECPKRRIDKNILHIKL